MVWMCGKKKVEMEDSVFIFVTRVRPASPSGIRTSIGGGPGKNYYYSERYVGGVTGGCNLQPLLGWLRCLGFSVASRASFPHGPLFGA
jgi:hypothetical protein